mmetsp:Transcript_10768/g.18047  ORF Transcript_10768/g.18047 Transcript_10768/m.18047 type:complete len:93 (-) Transcript_10768:153-431(-)
MGVMACMYCNDPLSCMRCTKKGLSAARKAARKTCQRTRVQQVGGNLAKPDPKGGDDVSSLNCVHSPERYCEHTREQLNLVIDVPLTAKWHAT